MMELRTNESIKLIHDDCLVAMSEIPDNSIDLCLTDPPYGTTACAWDSTIALYPMWHNLKRIVKDNGAICLFGSEPFSTLLRASNLKMFKYDWIWHKQVASNFATVKYQPLKEHEIVSVFSCKTHRYYPLKIKRRGSGKSRAKYENNKKGSVTVSGIKRDVKSKDYYDPEYRNPSSVVTYNPRKEKRGFIQLKSQ